MTDAQDTQMSDNQGITPEHLRNLGNLPQPPMPNTQDTQWLSKMRGELLKALGVESGEQYIDNKAKFILEDILPIFLAHEAEAVAAGKLEVMKSDYEDIYHIHMAHDWNEMSDDTREWLMKRLHNIHRLQREQEGK